MTEDLVLQNDWVKKEFPGYNIEEVEEACEALRNDFISDEAFFNDFLRYNNDDQLMNRINREHKDSDYTEIVDDFVIPIALEVDRDFVEQYLEDHFTPMDEAFGDTVGTITAQFIVNNYMVGSRLRSTPTHKISKQERIDPKHTIIEFSGLTKRELESIEKILAKKGKVLSESYLTEADDDTINIGGNTFEKTKQYSFKNGKLHYHSYAHPEGVPESDRPYRVTPKYNMYVNSQRGAQLPYSAVLIANKETGDVYRAEFSLYLNIRDTYAKIVEWMRNGGYLEPEPEVSVTSPDEEPFNPLDFGESLKESYLIEAEDDDSGDFGTEDFDEFESDIPAEEETEVTVDDIDNDKDADINEMYKKEIQFPILIEGFDEEGNAISMEEKDEGQYASEYGEAVVQQVEENKKFILSALDIYDFELFYESYDSNSNVKFAVTSNKELDSSILMNILKRYFNVEMDAKTLDYGEFTLNPVLDNKFIKIS